MTMQGLFPLLFTSEPYDQYPAVPMPLAVSIRELVLAPWLQLLVNSLTLNTKAGTKAHLRDLLVLSWFMKNMSSEGNCCSSMFITHNRGLEVTVKKLFCDKKKCYLQQPFCYFPKGGRSCLNNPALKILQTFQGILFFFLHPKNKRHDSIFAVQPAGSQTSNLPKLQNCTETYRAE